MGYFQSIIAQHDRGRVHRTTSTWSQSGWLTALNREWSAWLRWVEWELALAANRRFTPWYFTARRWQPIPVAVITGYLARTINLTEARSPGSDPDRQKSRLC